MININTMGTESTRTESVDVMIAKHAAQAPHDSGSILVAHHEQDAFGNNLDRLTVESNDPRMLGQSKERPGDGYIFVIGPGADV